MANERIGMRAEPALVRRLDELIDREARRSGLPVDRGAMRSAVLRRALEAYLDAEEARETSKGCETSRF